MGSLKKFTKPREFPNTHIRILFSLFENQTCGILTRWPAGPLFNFQGAVTRYNGRVLRVSDLKSRGPEFKSACDLAT